MPWRNLPELFGDGLAIHLRFSRWAKSGVWERVFQHLAADAAKEYAMIDSTIVRAHQHSAGAKKVGEDQAIGRSRGGLIVATDDGCGTTEITHRSGLSKPVVWRWQERVPAAIARGNHVLESLN